MNKEDAAVLRNIRKRIFGVAYKTGVTHIASAFSCLEILYALYAKKILNYKDNDCSWENRDRLILSKGHAAIGLYAILEHVNLIEKGEFDTFLRPGTRLGGEPCRRDLPVIEASTGSLGHGLPLGVGMALAQKMDGSTSRTYVVLGDGECEEGSIWESAMSASKFELDNLTVILDCNGLQKMNTTQDTIGNTGWKEKWSSFGWAVSEVDGHDVEAICELLSQPNKDTKPHFIIADTIKGKGLSIMENDINWHYKAPNKRELKAAMIELDIKQEELN